MLHSKLKIMKAELKVLALDIRKYKSQRKDKSVTKTGYIPALETAQFNFRAKHIARCMLRGKTLEQIEPKLRNPNDWTHSRVRQEAARIVVTTLKSVEVPNGTEDICTSGQAPVAIAADSSVWSRVTKLLS